MRPSTQRLRRGLRDIGPAIYRAQVQLEDLRLLPLGTGIVPAEMAIPASDQSGWRPVAVGDRWGGRDQTAWLHAEAAIPADWQPQLAESRILALRLVLGYGTDFGWPEALLYVNGRLRQGINRHHPDVLLPAEDASGGRIAFDVRAWSGMNAGDHQIAAGDLALLDETCEALYYLLAMGADTVDALAEDDPLTYALADALEHAYDQLDLREPLSLAYERSAHVTLGELRARLAELRAEYQPARSPIVTAIGHGHLDVAWLWQTRHTREKTARTFGIATALMEWYPEYVFLHTTPQVYAWLQEDYPDLYARVRERVAEGRFEAAGAMWLESDCNLVSGESLVRQILYGQRFLREAFGRECDLLWLPDAFGYSAALPQIMLKSGLHTFVTTKLSWSETNRIPADTFRWRGLDGSDVLAHFITTPSLSPTPPLDKTDTYNGVLTVPAVRGVWQRYQQKARNDELLVAFGFGDGGAGPNRQQIEQARALQALPGLPEVSFGRADAYFARLRERVWSVSDLPIWDGELYLEYHRGTYTTQAELKRAHRQNEGRLLLAELLDAWHWAEQREDAPDRRATLDEAWRTLLLHEFHDILPGSSIGEVYDDARVAMSELAAQLEGLISEGLGTLARQVASPSDARLVFNPAPWSGNALLSLPARAGSAGWAWADDPTGAPLPSQDVEIGGEQQVLVAVDGLPGLGYRVLVPAGSAAVGQVSVGHGPAHASERMLENDFFRLEVSPRGEIISLVDKRVAGGRELVPMGRVANELQIFDDRPRNFDAWDIDEGYERAPYQWDAATVEVVERGPLCATLRMTRQTRMSVVEQRLSLYRDLPRIDFATTIEWHEHHVLLKAAFPLDLRATEATYETQYGAITRPTHRNTSWDQARFEVPAHRWVDLSEADYGVSLLNDGRYGHDVRENVVRLTLLRSPTSPDPNADQGHHEVTYSLFPHLGDWRAGGTVPAAYALNRPVRVVPLSEAASSAPSTTGPHTERAARVRIFAAEPANAVIEAVKRAADGDGLIVRLYEAHGARAQVHIQTRLPLESVTECDLLERPLTAEGSPAYPDWVASPVASHEAPESHADGWTCALRPFEIRTFRLRLTAPAGG